MKIHRFMFISASKNVRAADKESYVVLSGKIDAQINHFSYLVV